MTWAKHTPQWEETQAAGEENQEALTTTTNTHLNQWRPRPKSRSDGIFIANPLGRVYEIVSVYPRKYDNILVTPIPPMQNWICV